MRVLVLALGYIFSTALYAFEIPKGLTSTDRSEVVRTLGINSAPKSLSNPYPLGGYSGFELGYSMEVVNVRDIRRIGCEPKTAGCQNESFSDETEWRYSRLTVGKGIYNDIDLFFSFMPPMGNVRASDYGGQIRWSFYQAAFLPVNLSAVAYFNSLNFNDTFMNRNVGAELMAGVNVNNFALYFGGGMVQARGTFIGANDTNVCQEDCTVSPTDPDTNSTSRTITQSVRESHTFVGFSLHFQNLFAAAQVDRYRDAVYSAKVGLRF
jgi:hypothetical protein